MHELDKNEKKKESRARPVLQTRTDPTVPSVEEEQQKRIAARAATAMAQVLQRRREPRSLMMWGDRKKAVIKRYPDGSQEIIVPQTLTAEQENYEFPPRSRFLKKLATSTAERRRISVLQDHLAPSAPHSTPSTESIPAPALPSPSAQPSSASVEMKEPDQLALNEWFTKKENRTMSKKSEKNRAVIDWMNDVERQSKSLLTNKKYQRLVKKPSPSTSQNSNKIQFKSEAGKRWANSILANASLLPPDDGCRKHYVPRRLLSSSIQQHNFKSNGIDFEEENKQATEAASKIQMIWKEYQNKSSQNALETQVGMAAMASTGQRTPIAGMVQLVQMLHQSLDIQKQKSHHRMVKLESLLKEETRKRQEAEANIKRLESMYCTTEKRQSLLKKVTELEKEENKRTMKKQPSTQSTASKKSVRSRKSLVPESPITKTTHLRSSSIAITRNVPIKPAVAPPSTARRLTVAPHIRRPIQ